MSATIPGDRRQRVAGLRRFAVAITVFNILGHCWFGFEQSYLQPFVALATAYGMEFMLEIADALACRRAGSARPFRFAGGPVSVIDFFLSAHISALAIAMLLYTNQSLAATAFAAAVAIGSKHLVLAPVSGRIRHVLNPSNFGISVTLVLFPWVGIAPPYQFTENIQGLGDWILPGFIILSGSLLNALFTKRLPLILSWLAAFALQAWLRHLALDASLLATLGPMTGVAFILFTFYMVSDPATTPSSLWGQVLFGVTIAAIYAVLTLGHIVFGLFFALSSTCILRGIGCWIAWWHRRGPGPDAGPKKRAVEPSERDLIAASV
jgi:hypothetical protein